MKKCNEDCFNCPYDDCIATKRDAKYWREYYKNHKEQILKTRKKYAENNQDKIKEYRKKYYKANKEKILKKQRERRNENRSKKQVNNNGISAVGS